MNSVRDIARYLEITKYDVFVRSYRVAFESYNSEIIKDAFDCYEIDGSTPKWVQNYCERIKIPALWKLLKGE